MTGVWQPVSPAHSIGCVATVVSYSEPLSEYAVKRVLRKAESLALAHGLTSRNDVRTIHVAVMPDDAHQVRNQVEVDGIGFQKLGQTTPAGRKLLQDLVVTRNQLVFRDFGYQRWKNYLALVNNLIVPLAAVSTQATDFASLRLEYLDRFISPEANAELNQLLRPNPMIAPHVFDTEGFFHSHTGRIDPIDQDALLTQLHVDYQEANFPDRPNEQAHSIAIMTGLERRYGNQLDVDSQRATYIEAHLADLHTRSKNLFRSILTSEIAKRVGLEVQK